MSRLESPELRTSMQAAVEVYLSGDVPRAITMLTHDDDHPQFLYARALLTLELERPADATVLLEKLVTKFPNDRLSIAGRHVLQSF